MLAGLTVASMLIPQSVSYATSLAQLSPLTGLVGPSRLIWRFVLSHCHQFSAAIPGIVYAFLGTCRQLNVAPEAAISLLVGQAIGDFLLELPDPHSDDAAAITIAISTIITMQVKLFV